jgi:hypothetical protein
MYNFIKHCTLEVPALKREITCLKVNEPGLLGKAVLSFVVLILLFGLICQESFGISLRGENLPIPKYLSVDLPLVSIKEQSFSTNLPHESKPIPSKEVPNDKQFEEDFDEDEIPAFAFISIGGFFNLYLKEGLSLGNTCLFQTHSKVPFFILYHSWKSFLS